MVHLARQQLYFGRFFTLDEMIENVEAVTAGEVREAAQAFFDPRNLALTILGSLDGFHLGRQELIC